MLKPEDFITRRHTLKSIIWDIIIGTAAILTLAALFTWGCGNYSQDAKADVGMPVYTPVPQHGHSSPIDGGNILMYSMGAIRTGGDQLIPAGVLTVVLFNSKLGNYIGNVEYTTATGRWVPKYAGNYYILSCLSMAVVTPGASLGQLFIYKNEVQTFNSAVNYSVSPPSTACIQGLVTVNGTTDYITIRSNYNLSQSSVSAIYTSSFFGYKIGF